MKSDKSLFFDRLGAVDIADRIVMVPLTRNRAKMGNVLQAKDVWLCKYRHFFYSAS